MSLTISQKERYVEGIQVLFGGTIHAETYQITEEVIHYVDQFIDQVRQCSHAMAQTQLSFLYALTFGPAVAAATGAATAYFLDVLAVEIVAKFGAKAAVKKVLSEWVGELGKGYQFPPCLNGARLKWRSKIELELMGL